MHFREISGTDRLPTTDKFTKLSKCSRASLGHFLEFIDNS